MLGQPASRHTVCRARPSTRLLTSRYPAPRSARTRIQAGRSGSPGSGPPPLLRQGRPPLRVWGPSLTNRSTSNDPASLPGTPGEGGHLHLDLVVPEDGGEAGDDGRDHLLDGDPAPRHAAHRGHRAAGEAAGHDVAEPIEVARHVEREAVHGDGAGGLHPDGGHLALRGPDTGVTRLRPGFDAEVGQGADEHLLQAAHVGHHVGALPQVDDGVAHQLAGAVEGDVAPPVDPQDLGPQAGQVLRGSQDVGGVSPVPRVKVGGCSSSSR